MLLNKLGKPNGAQDTTWMFSCKVKFTSVGKGGSKKLMSHCNDGDRSMINLKGCWLGTGIQKLIKRIN